MKARAALNIILGIAVEVLYALCVMALAFAISLALTAVFKK